MIKRTRVYMGTFFTIIIDDDVEENIVVEAFREVERVEKIFSKFNENSELSLLNKDKVILNASKDFVHVLKKSLFYADITNGRYNPCILPLLELYSRKSLQEISEEEIKKSLELTDYKSIIIDEITNSVRITKSGVKVDLSSIAKGYAVDKASELLMKNGVSRALIDGGGDIRVIDGKKDNEYWYIGVRDPFRKGIRKILRIKDKSVATSGIYERFLDAQRRVTHIIDGLTGRPVDTTMSATVITDYAIDADALATALLILGENGIDLVEEKKLGEAYIILRNGKEVMTAGFDAYLVS